MVQEAEKAGRGPGHDIGRCCATVGVSATCRPLCTFNLDYELLTNLTSVCSQVSSEQYCPDLLQPDSPVSPVITSNQHTDIIIILS